MAEYYQNKAYKELTQAESKKENLVRISKPLAYLQGESFDNYLRDMKIVQQYAVYNRKAIVDEIVNRMGFEVLEHFTTIHNYIDLETMILRKGAISARKGEKVLIPMNMRDGSLICKGK